MSKSSSKLSKNSSKAESDREAPLNFNNHVSGVPSRRISSGEGRNRESSQRNRYRESQGTPQMPDGELLALTQMAQSYLNGDGGRSGQSENPNQNYQNNPNQNYQNYQNQPAQNFFRPANDPHGFQSYAQPQNRRSASGQSFSRDQPPQEIEAHQMGAAKLYGRYEPGESPRFRRNSSFGAGGQSAQPQLAQPQQYNQYPPASQMQQYNPAYGPPRPAAPQKYASQPNFGEVQQMQMPQMQPQQMQMQQMQMQQMQMQPQQPQPYYPQPYRRQRSGGYEPPMLGQNNRLTHSFSMQPSDLSMAAAAQGGSQQRVFKKTSRKSSRMSNAYLTNRLLSTSDGLDADSRGMPGAHTSMVPLQSSSSMMNLQPRDKSSQQLPVVPNAASAHSSSTPPPQDQTLPAPAFRPPSSANPAADSPVSPASRESRVASTQGSKEGLAPVPEATPAPTPAYVVKSAAATPGKKGKKKKKGLFGLGRH